MYKLMNKDNVVAIFDIVQGVVNERVSNLNVLDMLPIGCTDSQFSKWLSERNACKHREHLQGYLRTWGADTLSGFVSLTHAISINDAYWVCSDREDISWENVSPYSNDFDEVVQKLAFAGIELQGVQLSSMSPEFGTNGAYDKC